MATKTFEKSCDLKLSSNYHSYHQCSKMMKILKKFLKYSKFKSSFQVISKLLVIKLFEGISELKTELLSILVILLRPQVT